MKKNNGLRFFALITGIIIGLCSVAAMVGLIAFTNSPDYARLDLSKISFAEDNFKMLDNSGNSINNSEYIKLSELKPDTKNAFLAIEDKRFYSHNGIDYKGVARACAKNLSAGKFVEGGSTITQQLIKNTHLSGEKTYKRKANEFLLAYQLERALSKDEIFEAYLNTAYFGDNCIGLGNAATYYFGKNAADLTLSEAATLAGMLKSPNNYSPLKNAQNSQKRRDLVLEKMVENGFLDEKTSKKTQKNDIFCEKNDDFSSYFWRNSLVEAVNILGISTESIRKNNYKIVTFYDQSKAEKLAKAFSNDKIDYGADVQKLGIIVDNKTRGIAAVYGEGLKNGSIFDVKRQVGSLLKPLAVYAPSIETRQISVLTPVLDEEIAFGNYKPQNFGGKFVGWTTVNDALAKSLNIPAIKTLNMLGIETSKSYLNKCGINVGASDDNLTLALGCVYNGVSPTEISAAYTMLANGGTYGKIGFVKEIWLDDTKLYEFSPAQTRVFSEQTAYLTTYMLENAAKEGTAKTLADLNMNVAAKTGTVGKDKNSDLYMCGYTTDETFFTWVGSENSGISAEISAGKACGNIAKAYLNGAKTQKFTAPKDVIWVNYDKKTLDEKHILKQADSNFAETLRAPIWSNGTLADGTTIIPDGFGKVGDKFYFDNNENCENDEIKFDLGFFDNGYFDYDSTPKYELSDDNKADFDNNGDLQNDYDLLKNIIKY